MIVQMYEGFGLTVVILYFDFFIPTKNVLRYSTKIMKDPEKWIHLFPTTLPYYQINVFVNPESQ